MSDLDTIVQKLAQAAANPADGVPAFTIEPMPGQNQVARIMLKDQEEFPIFLSVADRELLLLCNLFHEDEVKSESRCQMLEAMLTMNIPMPLSDFGKVGQYFVIFGSMPVDTSVANILEDLVALAGNTLEALEAMEVYLK